MGWRNGSYAKLWQIEFKSDTWAKAQLSTSRKDKDTGEYITDFSRWVDFKGSANVQHLRRYKAGDRIMLDQVEYTNPKKPDGSGYYDNFTCWAFKDIEDGPGGGNSGRRTTGKTAKPGPKPVDDGEPDDSEDDYPF